MERSFPIFENCRSNRNGELAFSIEAEIADGAGVDSARMGFQLRDNFEGALFRGARDRTTGKAGAQRRRLRDILTERPGYGRDEVVDLFDSSRV